MTAEPHSAPSSPARSAGSSSDPLRALTPLLRRAEGSAVTAASGGSMGEPFESATEVRIELGAREAPAEGAIVAVADAGRLVLHRVIQVGSGPGSGFILTQGDARRFPDPPVPIESVIGRVSAVRLGTRWEPVSTGAVPGGRPSTVVVRAVFRRNVRAAVLLVRLLRTGETLVGRSRTRLRAGMRRLLGRDQSGTGLG